MIKSYSITKSKIQNRIGLMTFIGLLFASYNASAQYCDDTFWDGEYEYITNVNFAGIDNTTTDYYGFAQDFTTIGTATVHIGESYALAVTIEADEYESIDAFIDWNQNGILDDAGEVYTVVEDAMASGTYTMNITPPASALLGVTRMRVMVVYDRYWEGPDPCSSAYEYGEVEDYSITVSAALRTSNFDKSSFAAYPNPAQDILNIDYKSNIAEVKIFNMIGQEVLSRSVGQSNFHMNIAELSSGSYVVKLYSDDYQHSFKLLKI